MSKKQQTISPLRQRMIDEMNLRKLAVGTQKQYIRAVRKLADFLDFSPAQATAEDLRDFQVYFADIGTSKCTINMTLTGLSFFYREVFDQGEIMKRVRYVRQERKLPVILNREEMAQLIHAAGNNKDRAALSVAYGAGLRVSEVVKLKTTDIDSKRMAIRVEQGKGSRDRYAMLSPVLLEILRRWWREGHKQGVIPKGGWLFPSRNHSPFNHLLEGMQFLRQTISRLSPSDIFTNRDDHCAHRERRIRSIPIGIHAVDPQCNRSAVFSMRAFPTSTH